MTLSLWTVAAYALQLAALVTVAFAADVGCCGSALPRHSLRFWQAVMAIALLAAARAAAQRRIRQRSQLAHRSRPRRPRSRSGARDRAATASTSPRSSCWSSRPASSRDCSGSALGLLRLRSIVARASADDCAREHQPTS